MIANSTRQTADMTETALKPCAVGLPSALSFLSAMGVNRAIMPWPKPEKVLAIVEMRLRSFSSLVNDGTIDQ